MRHSHLFEKTSRWFDRSKAALLGNLPCAHGCSHCCVGLFPVTLLDLQEIQCGLRALPDDRRETIQRTAVEQVTSLTAAAPQLRLTYFIDHWADGEVDRLVELFETVPCPALERDGGCGLYEFRPLVCRSMGIPSDDGGRVYGACAVQTAVPLIRPSKILREEEQQLARLEAEELEVLRHRDGWKGEELFLPYAFLPDGGAGGGTDTA